MRAPVDRPVLLRGGERETMFDRPERTIRVLADRDELALSWFRFQSRPTAMIVSGEWREA